MNGVDECYILNTVGNVQGHCGIDFLFLFARYRRCIGIHYLCGLLQCEGGSVIGNLTEPAGQHNSVQVTDSSGAIHTCLSFSISRSSFFAQPDFVSRGSSCGTGMV